MNVLRELPDTRQVPGEPTRRWFTSHDLDLIVWTEDDGNPVGFQFCYDKNHGEHAFTWREGRGYDHAFVDDGEATPTQHKSTPILRADGFFEGDRVKKLFTDAAGEIPANIREYVVRAMDDYPGRAT